MFMPIIRVKAHPSATAVRFQVKGEVLHVWLTEPAEQGKANRQLIKEISALAGSCRLVKGATSVNKLLELPLSLKTLEELLV